MSDSPATRHSIGTLQEILQKTKPEDFDGHTEFHRLTPEQRLAWLDQAVAFIQTAKNARQSSQMPAQLP